ncbi:MAG: peptidase, partial [Planctomycetes bacterium]|nr:peptidase [Planctomycetota bacterium]
MTRLGASGVLSLVLLLAVAQSARAQRIPQIGYAYPAGGQRGGEIDVTIGGQYLSGTDAVSISGEGLEATVSEYIRPLRQQEINELRQKLRELQQRVQAAMRKETARKGAKRALQPRPALVKQIAEELGLEATDMKSIEELRQKLNNPKAQPNPQIAELVILRIRISADAAVGARELRLRTAAGVSNPISFHVAQWAEIREKEPNDRAPDPSLPGDLPVVINGQILPGDADRFRFTARKGQRIVCAASARELTPYLADAVPGWFQATLALYEAAGTEAAFADDYRYHPDPVLFFQVPEDGAYILEIRDAIYRGREDFVYRIAVGELPFITSIFPLGAKAGETAVLELKGWNLPSSSLELKTEEGESGLRAVRVEKDGIASNAVPFAAGALAECREREPQGDAAGAQPIELPVVINGRIDRPGDRDVFRFEAREGDEIVAAVHARRLGSPLDSRLELISADGRLLAANDDHQDRGAGLVTHHADSRLSCAIPSAGVYSIQITDTQDKGGDAYGYRLHVGPPRPDFELRLVPSSISARAGETVPVTVFALRRDGFDGEISLHLTGAPEGFALGGAWVPAGQEQVVATLTVPPAPRREPFKLSLEGRASIGGREVSRDAVPADDRMQAFFYRHLV